MSNNDDYEVGYKKPPLHSRIKPGECRNPHGRRKGSKNVDTILNEVMNATATIRENGKERRVSRTQIIIMKQVKKAAEDGDTRAAQYLLDRKAALDAAKVLDTEAPVSTPDASLLEDYRQRILEEEEARRRQEAATAPPKPARPKSNKEDKK